MISRIFSGLAVSFLLAFPAMAEEYIVVQSTTSTQNSGLFDHILPIFQDASGIEVRVVAVGTGQALKNGANGDGDVVFVHAKPAEEKFVADGHGVARYDVMYNDFVVVGPASAASAAADPRGRWKSRRENFRCQRRRRGHVRQQSGDGNATGKERQRHERGQYCYRSMSTENSSFD